MTKYECPCCSGKLFEDCCQPFIVGEALPETPLELMRSRYTAYTLANIEYIIATSDPKTHRDMDIPSTKVWAKNAVWKGLDIVSAKENRVEFVAHYQEKGVPKSLHENSLFAKIDGRWCYVEGQYPKPETVVNAEKVGRNDPCPCNSGKKYKKCCA